YIVMGKMLVDRRALHRKWASSGFCLRPERSSKRTDRRAHVAPAAGCEHLHQRRQLRRRYEHIRQPGIQGISGTDHFAGYTEIGADFAWRARQEIAAADIRE